jgi:hypothetical protein
MKLLLFKYTVLLLNQKTPSTFYIEAYNQDIGREELAKKLNVNPNIIRWNNKNIPFDTRKKLNDKNNTEYTIFLSVQTEPEKPIKEVLDLTKSIKKTLIKKVDRLFKDDEDLLSAYNDNRYHAYKDLRKQIIKNNLTEESVGDDVTLLERLDSYLANQSPGLQLQFNEK